MSRELAMSRGNRDCSMRRAKWSAVVTTGGWIWILAEHPVKAYFRRRRPFIDVVRALVVGNELGVGRS